MKKIIILFLIALIIPIVYSESLSLGNVNDVTVNNRISSGLNLDYQSGYSIDYAFANLTFFPRDDIYQDILSQDINPDAEEINNNYILIKWYNPNLENIDFYV